MMDYFKLSSTKRAAKLLFLFLSCGLFLSCEEDGKSHFQLIGETMGTSYHITVIETDAVKIEPQDLQLAIDQQLNTINQQMSTYIESSELMQFNRALVGEWVNVSPNLFDVVVLSMELGWLSNGAFDITISPLVNLWGFGPGSNSLPVAVPAQQAIEKALLNTGFQHIEMDFLDSRIRKLQPISLDLSGIAKGYGVDKVAELLNYAGYSDYMVEIGGELRLQGNSPRGGPWRIAIEQPDADMMGEVYSAVTVSGVGMATSGDYRNYFEQQGKRYSHTINPKTGYPIEHNLASVTVVSESAAFADGVATAINVMGAESGMKMAEQQELAVYMILKTDDGFSARYSQAFTPYLETDGN